MKIDTSPIRQSETLGVVRPYARDLLRNAMRRRKIGFQDLSERLAELGIRAPANTLVQRVRRMEFSAHFLIVCLKVLEVDSVDLQELDIAHTVRERRPRVLVR